MEAGVLERPSELAPTDNLDHTCMLLVSAPTMLVRALQLLILHSPPIGRVREGWGSVSRWEGQAHSQAVRARLGWVNLCVSSPKHVGDVFKTDR